ncbi:hypothetical protein BTO06_11600 [Tenacibaculum sp. SZ-18]|uniref:T9SS type A sorting domain-containing protein n=1 Tax=Tenacibaculum sp. SZ-18 TaxID=754423 RepID=UPI000C2D5B44|nr:T9SS type A sorting domain-containing protein [Tenacibaculum sp. SZ-18]AUC15754.1 hypothetical protein BTO06_11600 [Tenacibaculum sp. SZ-18]
MYKEYQPLDIVTMFKEVLRYFYCIFLSSKNKGVSKNTQKKSKNNQIATKYIYSYCGGVNTVTNNNRFILVISFVLLPFISMAYSKHVNNAIYINDKYKVTINCLQDIHNNFIHTRKTKRSEELALTVKLDIIHKPNVITNYKLQQALNTIPFGFVTINKYSEPLNIGFYSAKVNYIDSDTFYEKNATRVDYVPHLNTLSTNFFSFNKGRNFTSTSNSPSTPNAFFFSKFTFGSPFRKMHSSFPYEIGHYFGLMQTLKSTRHGNNHPQVKNVSHHEEYSNFSGTGDYLCSTPTNPHNSSNEMDKHGKSYNTYNTNLMSYYREEKSSSNKEKIPFMNKTIDYRLNDKRYHIHGYEMNVKNNSPQIILSENTHLSNNIEWTNSNHYNGYIIEKSINSDSSQLAFEKIANVSKKTSVFTDNNINSNTSYNYGVIPVDFPENRSNIMAATAKSTYCNPINTCNYFGLTPERITLKTQDKTIIDHANFTCSNTVNVADYKHVELKTNTLLNLEIDQSRKQEFFYNVFIDFNRDSDFNDEGEWLIKNKISTDKYSFDNEIDLTNKIFNQGETTIRVICSNYKDSTGTYPIENACDVELGFTQDFNVTLLDKRKDVTWLGTTNKDWFTPSNWSNNLVPDENTNVIIPNYLEYYPVITDEINFNTLKVDSGASLIANTAIQKEINYDKKLSKEGWNYISTPMVNQTVSNFIQLNNVIVNEREEISLSYFNTLNNTWNPFMNDSDKDLEPGKGYSIKLTTGRIVTFNGNIKTEDTYIPLNQSNYTNMNLIGNPYLSYIDSEELLNKNSNILTEQTLWIWNGQYFEAVNKLNPIKIAPSDSFFVEANVKDNFVFHTKDLRQRNEITNEREQVFSVELSLENSTHKQSTKIYYTSNTSKSFDNGYDSKIFDEDSDFQIFTDQLDTNNPRKLAIQALPNSDIENLIIPVGFRTKARGDLTISANILNIPDNYEVYLEDKDTNNFVNLQRRPYVFTPKNNVVNQGRFFLHMNQKSTNQEHQDSVDLQRTVTIFKSDINEITINNLDLDASVKVYTIYGESIFDSKITSSDSNKIRFNTPPVGIYLVSVKTEKGKFIKKINL